MAKIIEFPEPALDSESVGAISGEEQETLVPTPQEVLASIEELERGEVDIIYPKNWKAEKKEHKATLYGNGKTIQYQRVPMCGHQFVPGHEPTSRNCEPCWFAFFQVHGELTEAVSKVYTEQGAAFLTAIRGPKFTKHFKRYVEALANFQKAVEANKEKETSVTSIGSTSGSDPEAGAVAEIR